MRNIRLLGLDLSLRSTGHSHAGVTGVITPSTNGVERLDEVSESIIKIISLNAIDVALIEGYSFASRSGQAFSIGELGGVVRLSLFRAGIPFVEIPPTCRAKFATGRGNASKTEVVSSVSARTGIIWSGKGGDDRCDAWILEEMAQTHLGVNNYSWPSINKEGLKAVDWKQLDVVYERIRSEE